MQVDIKFESRCDSTLCKRTFDTICKERDRIGYYDLPLQETKLFYEFANTLAESIDTVAVIGIGGSALGAKAIYHFLKPARKFKRKLIFFESTDPIDIQATLEAIDISSTRFFVISKSGTTIETIAVYKYIRTLINDPSRFTFITEEDSPLHRHAQEINAQTFFVPKNVGGRFSALSAVGLLPLVCVGVDIKALLQGAKRVRESFFGNGYLKAPLLQKAYFYAKNHRNYPINCLFAYSESFHYFCDWYVQLWGESLGKRQRHSAFHVGLTPIGLIGPKDQHSFLQLIMEGARDKTVTFLTISNFQSDMRTPAEKLPYLETLGMLDNLSFSDLITMQCDAVSEALLQENDIPVDTITIEAIDEGSIGELVYYYELLTSLVAYLIGVNAYDQPGVEAGKKILRQKLNL